MAITEADILRRRIARLTEQLEFVESLPRDEFEDGDVISFTKTFRGTSEYNYAAIKAKGAWYISGANNRGRMSWDELVRFIAQDEPDMPEIFYVTEWSAL